jgi:hypothetical protein
MFIPFPFPFPFSKVFVPSALPPLLAIYNTKPQSPFVEPQCSAVNVDKEDSSKKAWQHDVTSNICPVQSNQVKPMSLSVVGC